MVFPFWSMCSPKVHLWKSASLSLYPAYSVPFRTFSWHSTYFQSFHCNQGPQPNFVLFTNLLFSPVVLWLSCSSLSASTFSPSLSLQRPEFMLSAPCSFRSQTACPTSARSSPWHFVLLKVRVVPLLLGLKFCDPSARSCWCQAPKNATS